MSTSGSPKGRSLPMTHNPPKGGGDDDRKERGMNVHVIALDGVVNVNSLFTVAIFVGLTMASPEQLKSLNDRKECQPGPNTAKLLVVFEILSFSFFLFSSLVAQSIKLFLNLQTKDNFLSRSSFMAGCINQAISALHQNQNISIPGAFQLVVEPVYKMIKEGIEASINEALLPTGVMVSALSSIIGCVFLVVSMVNVVELKLGALSCNATAAIVSVAFLIPLSAAGVIFYVFMALKQYFTRVCAPKTTPPWACWDCTHHQV